MRHRINPSIVGRVPGTQQRMGIDENHESDRQYQQIQSAALGVLLQVAAGIVAEESDQ